MKNIFAIVVSIFLSVNLPVVAGNFAILIGINDYNDTTILDMSTPRNDVKDLSSVLQKTWSRVFEMTDDKGSRSPDYPNKSNIIARIELLADFIDATDSVMIFYSGHGIRENGKDYILPVDISGSSLISGAIAVDQLIQPFQRKGIKQIVLAIDACRQFVTNNKGLMVIGVGGANQAGSTIPATVFYATKEGWYSYEDQGGRNSVFAKFLIDGLSGFAAKTGSTQVSVSDLAQWLPDAVGIYALDNGYRQKPVVSIHSDSAGMVLSKDVRPRQAASALPSATQYYSIKTEPMPGVTAEQITITIKTAEIQPHLRDAVFTIVYQKHLDPRLRSASIFFEHPKVRLGIKISHSPLEIIPLNSIEKQHSIQWVNDNKYRMADSPEIWKTLLDNTSITVRSGYDSKVLNRFILEGLKEWIESQYLTVEEITNAMRLQSVSLSQ